ncbi:hypothetical protein [Streptomyces sp. NBC_00038]|uniref:hypothetical protein n=1 Tax=Streptomyces sp. NBC_00038 TaxID=2903615 RepID=UPI00225356EB|nr:hypothetical protein [Streptomyces sp. NBC_00038]MCX5559857.1 hypothetical protein [Streptomyces sp. NBC_00038]
MARRTMTTTAVAFTASAALLLTACGGSEDSSSDDIKGADTGSSSPSASASASAASGAERPDITLPSSFKLTFEDWTSSDPNEQAILDDAREQLRAGYAAIIAKEPEGGAALAFYDTESGLSQDRQWIKSYTDKDLTVFGDLPAFDPKVTLGSNKTSASLNYCTDESKAYSRNRETGKVAGNPAGTDPEVFYIVSLAKNAQGIWQNVSTRSERGACSR